MTEGIRKASNRVRKACKTVSLGKGSHSVLQRVVGCLIASVQIADERMGFVQVSAVCAAGVSHRVTHGRSPTTTRPSTRTVSRCATLADKATLCPPTPHLALGGPPAIFPPLFPPKGLCIICISTKKE